MALQTSGAISLANIASEFGGTAPHSLSEYYGAASGIPASGAISLSQFYGKSSGLAPFVTTWTKASTSTKDSSQSSYRPSQAYVIPTNQGSYTLNTNTRIAHSGSDGTFFGSWIQSYSEYFHYVASAPSPSTNTTVDPAILGYNKVSYNAGGTTYVREVINTSIGTNSNNTNINWTLNSFPQSAGTGGTLTITFYNG